METLPRIGGGLDLPRFKPGVQHPPVTIALPDTLVFPLIGHQGRALQACVVAGERVHAGQLLAPGMAASANGVVRAIEDHATAHPSGMTAPSVILDVDHMRETTVETDRATLDLAGIVGHGGAGYSLSRKLSAVTDRCRFLIINAAECEPGIACDESLLRHDAGAVLEGVKALMAYLQPEQCVLAIESDKTQAITSFEDALKDANATDDVRLLALHPTYPSGAERLLVNQGLQWQGLERLPSDQRPGDRGIACINVATAHAVAQMLNTGAATQRLVTINANEACTARVTLGTPVQHVLDVLGALPVGAQRVRVGGPLSGYDLADLAAPVLATCNALTVATPVPEEPALPCIRCGDCVPVCPMGLYPQQLFALAQAQDTKGLQRQGIDRCITCGCCDIACPSLINLTTHFRSAQSRLREHAETERTASHAEALHERHRERVARDEQRTIPGTEAPTSNAVSSALSRARARRKRNG